MKQTILSANDNGGPGADFIGLPETFLTAYQTEILGWAANLQAQGPYLKIMLWNRPGASIFDLDYQPEVTLRCDLLAHPVSRVMKMAIQPDTERDAVAVLKHVEVLPGIIRAQRDAAQRDRGKSKKMARWEFHASVPDYFVERYQTELRAWAANFARIGIRKHIVLREGSLADLSPDEQMGAVLLRVTLRVEIDRRQGDELVLVAYADDEQSEMLIRKHCEKMQRNKVPTRMALVEPERAGIPFMPDRVTP